MEQTNKKLYVVIRCGYEGIESLVFGSLNGTEASNKVKSLRQDILNAVAHRKKVLDEFGREEDENFSDAWDRMYYEGKISNKEHDNSKFMEPDAYCVMKFDGDKFSCACKELDCEPDKNWAM